MRLTLRVKLFLVLLLTTGAVVTGMYLIMQWSFERGFISLVEARQQEQVAAVITRLTDEYVEAGGWQRLGGDRARWAAILFASRPGREGRLPHWARRQLPGLSRDWPPPRAHRDGGNEGAENARMRRPRIVPLEFRMMLLDTDRSLLFGNPNLVPRLDLEPITVDGKTVGWLGILPGPALNEVADIRFFESQRKTFLLIAALMVLLAAALSLPLAGAMMRRLREITNAARALANGHYDARAPVSSQDELGQLARDMNELAKALARTEQTRRQWVADISHELRTPLSVLRGELEALQDGVRTLDLKAIDSLYADTLRIGRLVDDLYDLARSDLGALRYRKAAVDPIAVLKSDLAAMADEFAEQQIEVRVDAGSDRKWRVNGDAGRLSQLFRNVLTNTLRYTDPAGQLEIRASRRDRHLLIEFLDTAPGVPEDEIAKLFERFHRVESSRSRAHGGAGLGLAICRSIVEAHDGTITASPSMLGGIAIRIELPLLP